MRASKSTLIKSALVASIAAGVFAASSASAASYVVCNRWDECWRVHEKYTFYPPDFRIVYHDDAWYEAHQKDARWHWLHDPDNDKGWYDKDGNWHAYDGDTPAPPP